MFVRELVLSVEPCTDKFVTSIVHVNMVVHIKGVVNCHNSRDKGPPEGNSARG